MNNDQHPLLGALGLCRKAGKLLHGYDRVQENALRGKVALVLLTADASERTVKHMKEACEGIVACEQIPLTSAHQESDRDRSPHYRRELQDRQHLW